MSPYLLSLPKLAQKSSTQSTTNLRSTSTESVDSTKPRSPRAIGSRHELLEWQSDDLGWDSVVVYLAHGQCQSSALLTTAKVAIHVQEYEIANTRVNMAQGVLRERRLQESRESDE